MRLRPLSPPPLVLAIVLGLLPLALVACDGETPTSDEAPADAYTTRGLVVALPNPSAPGSELQIHHEAIPGFRDAKGETVGMDSMTMPFPAGEELLQGIELGDRVEFDFEVRWQGSPPIRVTRIEALPAGTRLDFEAPPTAEPAAESTDAP